VRKASRAWALDIGTLTALIFLFQLSPCT
jgi:hypothetical protein